MNKISTSQRNIIILILSLLPFLIGSSYSYIQSSKMEYFGNAINISGSQRMRTMLISNYTQQIEDNYLEGDITALHDNIEILSIETDKYLKFTNALKNGDASLLLEKNTYPEIVEAINELEPQITEYLYHANIIISNPTSNDSVNFVVSNSLDIKNKFHEIVQLYQAYYDEKNLTNMNLDFTMILVGAIVTLFGILQSRIIKKHEYHAHFDYLTKLKNRHSLYEFIKDKETNNYVIFFIDLNKFKIINDTYGHKIGDDILIEVSNRLVDIFDKNLLFRYGGDEFIALIDVSNNETNSGVITDKHIGDIKRSFLSPIIDSADREHYIGLSMGIASSKLNINNWDSLIQFADELMYDSKIVDDHIVYCENEDDYKSKDKLSENIVSAIDNHLIKPYLQSLFNVSLKTREYFVVLGRWEFNDKTIMPSTFLPLLKRKGLSSKYDMYMIQSINDYYLELSEDHEMKNQKYIISLTESTLHSAANNNLVEFLNNLDIPRNQLIFKLSESSLLNDNLTVTISKLVQMDFNLGIDNFTISFALRRSEIFKSIKYISLSKLLVNSIFDTDYPINVLEEFIKMLQSIDKTIIAQGSDDESILDIIHTVNSKLTKSLYYSNPYTIQPLTYFN